MGGNDKISQSSFRRIYGKRRP